MKKSLALLLAFVMLLAFAACGNSRGITDKDIAKKVWIGDDGLRNIVVIFDSGLFNISFPIKINDNVTSFTGKYKIEKDGIHLTYDEAGPVEKIGFNRDEEGNLYLKYPKKDGPDILLYDETDLLNEAETAKTSSTVSQSEAESLAEEYVNDHKDKLLSDSFFDYYRNVKNIGYFKIGTIDGYGTDSSWYITIYGQFSGLDKYGDTYDWYKFDWKIEVVKDGGEIIDSSRHVTYD